jgi:hypothetical protein
MAVWKTRRLGDSMTEEIIKMFVNTRGMSRIEKPRLAFERSLGLISLGIFLLLGTLLSNVLLDTRLLAADRTAGPYWIEVNLLSLPALARHRAVVVAAESGETLCVIGGDSKQVYCYPLDATGVPNAAEGELAYSLDKDLRDGSLCCDIGQRYSWLR